MILIGNRIKELRNKSRFTQSELAERLGVTKSTVAAYENDSRQPSYEVLVKMAGVFNVTIDSILLSRTGNILETDGLTAEQMEILEALTVTFRKGNIMEKYIKDNNVTLNNSEKIQNLNE